MSNVLFIKSSLSGDQGQSNILGTELISKFQADTSARIVERDLAKDNLPHLSQAEMMAWMTDPKERTQAQIDLAKTSDLLIEELQNSDTIVIGMPMYNLGIPSIFKAWVDRIARAGITFRYTENGPVGLLKDKKVFIVTTRGGIYAGTEHDSQTLYLKDLLAFIGIEDVTFIYAEGLNMSGSDVRLSNAREEINNITL